jgi:hypothetical protein
MAGSSTDRALEWEGGSLSELVSALQSAALPVRIEVIAPGTTDSNAGEVHLLAGGLADAFAGSLRRDDAMAALQRLEGARFLVESRLPNPESGSLSEPGPQQGSLKDRPLAALMRYCEDYVLTCRLEVARGETKAVISYRRGEITGTTVGGNEGSELLPEVLAWSDGSYAIALEAPVLPPMPSKRRDAVPVVARPGERKRHTTLPLGPGGSAPAPAPSQTSGKAAPAAVSATTSARSAATSDPPVPRPAQAAAPAPTAQSVAARPPVAPAGPQRPAVPPAVAPQPRARAANQPARPPMPPVAAPGRPAPAVTKQPAGTGPTPAVPPAKPVGVPGSAAKSEVPAAPAPRPPIRRATPAIPPSAVAAVSVPASQLAPEMTTRGTPPVPAVPLVAGAPAHQAPRTAVQAAPSVAPATVKPPAQAPVVPATPIKAAAQAPAAPAAAKPMVPAPVAPTAAKPAIPAPVAPTAAKPTVPAPAAAKPVAQAPGKQVPASSNDLLPASGTIQAKPKHAHQLPPTVAPVEVSAESVVAPSPPANIPVVVPSRAPTPRRPHRVQRRVSEQSLKVYILFGLAIGAGVVIAYWAYWYLPLGHR